MELELWQSLSIAGLVLLIVEILTPTMFFLNLALACFVTAGVSVYFSELNILVPVWVVASAVFLFLLKPLQKRNKINAGTGMDKYVGQKARVIEKIDGDGGVISFPWPERLLPSRPWPCRPLLPTGRPAASVRWLCRLGRWSRQ